MAAAWIRGTFEGECQGGITPPQDHTRPDARWYGLELRHGVLRNAALVEVPPPNGEKTPFCQPRLDDCVFVSANGLDDWHHASVFDVRVHDWELDHHVEANNRTWAVMRGTLYARVDDGAPEPKPVLPRLAKQGLSLLEFVPILLFAAWLLWTCGWFTCCVWAVPVGLSHWRWKLTPSASASVLTKGLHGVAGLAVFLLAVGVLWLGAFGGPWSSPEDQCVFSFWIPGAFLLVCIAGASVLLVSTPLRAIWVLWSVFVSVGCLRSNAVCTEAAQPAAVWRSAVAQVGLLTGLGEKEPGAGKGGGASKGGGGEGEGEGGAGQGEGKGGAGTGEGGAGQGEGKGGAGTGEGGAGKGGAGTGEGGAGKGGAGTGEGGAGTGGTGKGGAGTGEGGAGRGGACTGEGGACAGGEGAGEEGAGKDGEGAGGEGADKDGQGAGKGEGAGDRITVDDALSDPGQFYGKKRQPVRLQGDLLFDFDNDQLKQSAQPQLRQLADLLRLQDERRVVLEGHSDGIGSATYNQQLSERRANAVRQWLIYEEHINPGQLEAKGFGTRRPVVPLSGNRSAQRPNRRVEVRVVEERP